MCPFISVNNQSDSQFRCIAPAAGCSGLSGISCIICHLQQEHSSASFETKQRHDIFDSHLELPIQLCLPTFLPHFIAVAPPQIKTYRIDSEDEVAEGGKEGI